MSALCEFCGAWYATKVSGAGCVSDRDRQCSCWAEAQFQDSQSGQVGGGHEEVEVGGDLGLATHSGSPAAVSAAHEMAEFAFDFRAGGAVVGRPDGIVSEGAGLGELGLVVAEAVVRLGASRCTGRLEARRRRRQRNGRCHRCVWSRRWPR